MVDLKDGFLNLIISNKFLFLPMIILLLIVVLRYKKRKKFKWVKPLDFAGKSIDQYLPQHNARNIVFTHTRKDKGKD